MTNVQDGIRLTKGQDQDDDRTAPIRIPSQHRQGPISHPVPVPGHRVRPVAAQPAGLPAGQMPHPPAAPQRNGFGITALCLGLVGLVFTLMPITGFIAVILGGLALIFGLLGWGRARRGQASNKKMAVSGTVLGAIGVVMGVVGIVIVFQAAAQFSSDMDRLTGSASGTSSVPYAGAPAEPAATSYTYEVTGNTTAGSLSFTDSNGDMSMDVEETKLPFRKTVTPEPNGNGQYLSASTMSTKGSTWITCTLKDDTGKVVETDTKRGAYASCMIKTFG